MILALTLLLIFVASEHIEVHFSSPVFSDKRKCETLPVFGYPTGRKNPGFMFGKTLKKSYTGTEHHVPPDGTLRSSLNDRNPASRGIGHSGTRYYCSVWRGRSCYGWQIASCSVCCSTNRREEQRSSYSAPCKRNRLKKALPQTP